jgi:heme/copper-type cytochrome/quinol oxidase subunit 2
MKSVLYIIAAAALLAALFVLFRPRAEAPPSTASTASTVSAASQPVARPAIQASASEVVPIVPPPDHPAEAGVVDLVVDKGRLVSGPNVVHVKVGDHVVLHVTSDAADELHLHGYNLHLRLQPHVMATLAFEATRAGRYPYELHRADLELGALEVYPR